MSCPSYKLAGGIPCPVQGYSQEDLEQDFVQDQWQDQGFPQKEPGTRDWGTTWKGPGICEPEAGVPSPVEKQTPVKIAWVVIFWAILQGEHQNKFVGLNLIPNIFEHTHPAAFITRYAKYKTSYV